MVEIAEARHSYNRLEKSNIGLNISKFNGADATRKSKKCTALELLVKDGTLTNLVEEWVLHRDVLRTRE